MFVFMNYDKSKQTYKNLNSKKISFPWEKQQIILFRKIAVAWSQPARVGKSKYHSLIVFLR